MVVETAIKQALNKIIVKYQFLLSIFDSDFRCYYVYEWIYERFSRFKSGQMSIEDEPRPGRKH